MTGTAWLILWAILLFGSLLVWTWLFRRVYRSFRALKDEVGRLMEAISSVKADKQTRLSQIPEAQTRKNTDES